MDRSLAVEPECLAPVEYARLAELENTIEKGQQTFIEVGNALLEIRDTRLYRDTHSTFESYCRQRWGFERNYANKLVSAAEVVTLLEPMGTTVPTNEAQARELAPLLSEPDALRRVWADTQDRAEAESRPVTAALITETRDVFTGAAMSSKTDDWATPQEMFDLLNSEFGFSLDVCASPNNAKCERYFTKEDDGLAQTWEGVCWMNPPYGSEIGAWVRKAYESSFAGATVVCLVPARTDTAWWWDYARHGEVRFVRGRLRFGGADSGAPFPSAVVVFGRPQGVVWWESWPVSR